MGANVLQSSETPTNIRVYKHGLRLASMGISHGWAPFRLSGLMTRHPSSAGARNDGKESPVTAHFTVMGVPSTEGTPSFFSQIDRLVLRGTDGDVVPELASV
jgi:hypothetical protein